MRIRTTTLAAALALALGACADQPTAPRTPQPLRPSAQIQHGTGLVLQNVTGTGILGDINFGGQAVITQLALNAVGGLVATGTLTGTVTALGQPITENFTTDVAISSTGHGRCDLVTVDLAPISITAIGGTSVDLQQANVTPSAEGPLGSLLCNLGQAVQGLAPLKAVSGLVTAINNLL